MPTFWPISLNTTNISQLSRYFDPIRYGPKVENAKQTGQSVGPTVEKQRSNHDRDPRGFKPGRPQTRRHENDRYIIGSVKFSRYSHICISPIFMCVVSCSLFFFCYNFLVHCLSHVWLRKRFTYTSYFHNTCLSFVLFISKPRWFLNK